MFSWAIRCLAMVVITATAFALLQGRDFLRPEAAAPKRAAEATRARALNEHVVRAGAHGHFVIEAVVEGQPIDFLIDTGASDVILDPADAARLGLRPEQLSFERSYQTANGSVRAAPVTLRELRIGQYSLYDVDAAVNEVPLGISLLGLSLLGEFGGYRVEGDRLYLYW